MINLHERMLPTSAGVEPATSWSPVGRRIQLSHRGRQISINTHFMKFSTDLFFKVCPYQVDILLQVFLVSAVIK